MKKRIIKKEDLEKEWFVGNNLNDKIYVGPLNEVKAKLEKDEVKNGLHEIGQISVDSGQIAITDPCRKDFDLTVDTNFGDGMFPVYEDWEDNKRLALYIPLDTDLHNALREGMEEKNK